MNKKSRLTAFNGCGSMGVSTVYYIPFRAESDGNQLDFRQRLTQSAYATTHVKD